MATTVAWGIHSGNLKDRSEPAMVATDARMVSIAARGHHACALAVDGAVFCWGQASEGQLGSGPDTILRDAPIAATPAETFKILSVGMDHTCAINIRNHLFC
jgi:alpha-tubulin suppressor-like RCC1 family protein